MTISVTMITLSRIFGNLAQTWNAKHILFMNGKLLQRCTNDKRPGLRKQNRLSIALQQRILLLQACKLFIAFLCKPCSDITIYTAFRFSTKHTIEMEGSIYQDLGAGYEDDDDYYRENDDSNDESYYIYVINAVLNGTARLNVLLPTATILAFTIFTPLITNDGKCTTLSHWLIGFFVVVLAASCIFFTFTDSFRTATGRLYYGMATFKGIWTFNGGRKKPHVPSDYRLRWADLFHASLSLVAFLTFAASHSDIVTCYYPKLPRKVTNTVPLVVGFVVSLLFVLFPSKRRGIGYPFLLQRDALYSRR